MAANAPIITETYVQRDALLQDVTELNRTSEGFVQVQGFIAREGIKEYMGWEVSETYFSPDARVKVLCPTEELSRPETLASLAHKPVTVGHPYVGLVTMQNYYEWAVGEASTDARIETVEGEDRLKVTMWLKDPKAIAAILENKRQLSAGYRHVFEIVTGTYVSPNGIVTEYQAIQRRIEFNHIALVEFGRAGSECALTTDSRTLKEWLVFTKDTAPKLDEAPQKAKSDNPSVTTKDTKPMSTENNLVDLVLSKDSVAKVSAIDKIAITAHIDNLATSHDTATKTLAAEHKVALDAKDAEIKTLTEANTALTADKLDDAAIAAMVNERATLLDTVKSMDVALENADTATTHDIKLQVLKAKNPTTDYSKDSAETVNAVFNVFSADAKTTVDTTTTDTLTGTQLDVVTTTDGQATMIANLQNARK